MTPQVAGSFESGGGKPRDRGYRRLLESHAQTHTAAGQGEHLLPTTPEAYREAVAAQICPVCGAGPWRILASHMSRAHGVSPSELRRLAGLRYRQSVCDADYSVRRRDLLAERREQAPLPRPEPREGIEAERAEMQRLYEEEGLNLRAIAKRYDLEKRQVGRILASRGVVMRDGSRSGAKLTEREVREIRRKAGQMTNRQLAEEYGVTASLISMIRTGRVWKDLEGGNP